MPTLWDTARTWLPDMLQASAGVSVTYARGAERITLTAVVGRVAFLSQSEGEGARRVELADRDYLVVASDLTFGVPREGDEIIEEIDGSEVRFSVSRPLNGEPSWRWSDPQRTQYRIHAKRVG